MWMKSQYLFQCLQHPLQAHFLACPHHWFLKRQYLCHLCKYFQWYEQKGRVLGHFFVSQRLNWEWDTTGKWGEMWMKHAQEVGSIAWSSALQPSALPSELRWPEEWKMQDTAFITLQTMDIISIDTCFNVYILFIFVVPIFINGF